MRQMFVDTSAWDALADGGDPNHETASLFRDEIAGHCRLVVTNYILDELYTLLLMNVGYQRTVAFKRQLDALVQESVLEAVWVSENVAAEAWEVFERFNVDKQWSFTDCVSYVVMKQHGIAEAFAFDHHFEQMGFLRHP
ncbi:MAG: type II toxin-antitoxin system VapC family toxin [Armatimonadetes bacterium]|nr:type II toxin-antitoxin system VapC family toxin [Armatimonadota bacterium]